MKMLLFSFLLIICSKQACFSQTSDKQMVSSSEIIQLINQYSLARETKDTILLKKILTKDIDQLVSSGEWRTGLAAAIEGMMASNTANPGSRKLTVDKIKFLSDRIALVDARYHITNPDATIRKMWSSFVVIQTDKIWQISAIRNMLPNNPN